MWFLTQPPGAFHLSLGLPLSLLLWDAGNDSSKAAWGEYSFQHRTLFPCILEPKEGKQWLQKLPLRDVRERRGAHRGGCGGTRSWWSGLPWGKALQRIGAPAALHDQLPNPVCLSATCFTTCSFGPPAAMLPVSAFARLSKMCLSGSSGIQHAAACLVRAADSGSSLESIHVASYFWNRGIYCLVPFPAGLSSQLPRPLPPAPSPFLPMARLLCARQHLQICC